MAEPRNLQQTARLVHQAGRYIRPSDQFRVRVLEAVREQQTRRKRKGPVIGLLLLGMAVMLSFVWLGHSLESFSPPRGITSTEVEQEAVLRSSRTNQTLDWALMEVMTDWRKKLGNE